MARETFARSRRLTGTGPGADGLVVVTVIVAVAVAIERAGGGGRADEQAAGPEYDANICARRKTMRVLIIAHEIN